MNAGGKMKRIVAMMICIVILSSIFCGYKANAQERAGEFDGTKAEVESTAATYYNKIIANSQNGTYGAVKSYSTRWFDALEPLEVIVRLIYGQSKYYKADKQAMAALLWYRRYEGTSQYCDEQNLYGVATKSGEFSSITGNSTETYYARAQVNTSSASWTNSANYVSLLWATVLENATAYTAMTHPDGYIGQKEYSKYDLFFLDSGENHETVTHSHAYDSGTNPYYTEVKSDGTRVTNMIWYIGIPGVGYYTTVAAAKEAYSTKYLPTEGDNVNVYYDFESFLSENP